MAQNKLCYPVNCLDKCSTTFLEIVLPAQYKAAKIENRKY